MDIRKAGLSDLDELVPLFDAYRQFYEQAPDEAKARRYLEERLANGQADVFLCTDNDGPLGFTLLYPTFCSVSAAPIFVLYDLFVNEAARRRGVGRALMETAQNFAREQGAAWMKLETAVTNIAGQSLYENMGWERDDEFHTYQFTLSP